MCIFSDPPSSLIKKLKLPKSQSIFRAAAIIMPSMKMLLITKILASLVSIATSWPSLFSQTQHPAHIEDCGQEQQSNFSLLGAKIVPDIPEPNNPLDLYINFNNNFKEVNTISAHYKYVLNGIPMPEITEQICANSIGPYLCPMPLGEHSLSKSFAVPNIGGKLEVQMEWRELQTSTSLLCIRALMVFPVWQGLRWH